MPLDSVLHRRRPRRQFGLIWFALGLVLTTATQRRADSLPLGPGELLLAAWALLVGLPRLLRNGRVPKRSLGLIALGYWWSGLFLLVAGGLVAVSLGLVGVEALHSTLAFGFVGVVCLFLLVTDRDGIRTELQYISIFTLAALTLLFLAGQVVDSVGPLSIWYGDVRFVGWARNPNQTALALVLLPFLNTHFAAEDARPARWLWHLGTLLTVVIGLFTRSDALLVGWAAAGGLYLIHGWVLQARAASTRRRRLLLRFALPVMALMLLTLTGSQVLAAGREWVTSSFEYRDQGSLRLILWANGIRAMAASPIVGLGGGGHSGFEPHGGFEAHNTLIDWGANTGLLGLGLYGWLLAWAAWRLRRQAVLLAGLAAVTAYSMFHLVFRHPLYWLMLFGLVVLAMEPKREIGEAASR